MRVETLNRAGHGRTDQRPTGDDPLLAIEHPRPCAAQVLIESFEEETRDTDSVLDLWEAIVMVGIGNLLTDHQVELIAQVEERVAALTQEVLLPSLGLANDRARLVGFIAADPDA